MSASTMNNQKLAINGGTPVRKKPFLSSCYVSGQEEKLLLECLHGHNWSSFKAGTEGWNLKEVCAMSSKDALKYGPTEIRFLGGKFVREFEALFAEMFNVKYAVSSNSATSCLVMALGALNLEPGDEVIVPCMSFNATATAIVAYQCIPVFVEVKEDTFCMDPIDIEKKINNRTKAIMVVHLGGNAADMDSIMRLAKKHHLKVIEDCAQAPGVTYKGSKVGTFGDAGIFSFTETKNINCGEGGVLITNQESVAVKARLIRNHGEGLVGEDWTDEQLMNIVGMNFRLTEFQAAVAIPQLQSLETRNKIRKENTQYLLNGLEKFDCLKSQSVEPGADYVCFMLKFVYEPKVGQPSRAELIKALNAEGIPVIAGYGRLMYENPMFIRKIAYGKKGFPFSLNPNVSYHKGLCPRSEKINQKFIWFKFINDPNTIKDMDDVINAFNKILG